MSFFKNFSKVLSQNTLNAQKRTYILSLKNSIHNPALYYLNQNEPPRDLYALSLVTYHLARRNQSDKKLVELFEHKGDSKAPAVASLPNSLVREYEDSQNLANQYGDQLVSVLRANGGDLPVHNAVHALWALEALNKSDKAVYEEHLFPIIKEKIQYASLNNLIELVSVLSNMKYFEDKALWQSVLGQLEKKFEAPGPQQVKYSGWKLDEYELDQREQLGIHTENERHYREIRHGGSEQVAQLKRHIREGWDWVKGAFLYRIIHREGRLTSTLDNFQEWPDRDVLRRGLEEARNAGVNVEGVFERLRGN